MRIVIVDDEALARERLRRFVEKQASAGYEVVGEAADGVEALQVIDREQPDLILLDIRMPGMDGMEVARHLIGMEDAPAIIFVTAYDEYALEAFRVQAVDYLLKPVKAERLFEALKIASRLKMFQWQALSRELDGSGSVRKYVSSKSRATGIVLVPIEDVFYFRAEHKYVTVRHRSGTVLIEDALKDLEMEFEGRFIRIHRNCLVAKDKLGTLTKNVEGQPCLRLRDLDEILEVSRRHVSVVRQFMVGE